MPPQEIAFAAPRTEEMTKVATIGAGAGITGAVEGIVVSVAPKLGALEPVFSWGALLGIPAMGVAGSLFTRGLLSDLFMGVAAGGLGYLGATLPAVLQEFTGARAPRQLGAGPGVKQLGQGSAAAAQRAQQAAAKSLGWVPEAIR